MSNTLSQKPLGLILQEADLVSVPQIQLALKDQACFQHLRLGEILALRGWIKQETADFFAEQWPELVTNPMSKRQPIGYYLKTAGLLDEDQIDDILFDQKLLGTKFGSTAIMKGWVKQRTMKFFLENLFCQPRNSDCSEIIQYSEGFLGNTLEETNLLYVGEPHITMADRSITLSSLTELDFELIEA